MSRMKLRSNHRYIYIYIVNIHSHTHISPHLSQSRTLRDDLSSWYLYLIGMHDTSLASVDTPQRVPTGTLGPNSLVSLLGPYWHSDLRHWRSNCSTYELWHCRKTFIGNLNIIISVNHISQILYIHPYWYSISLYTNYYNLYTRHSKIQYAPSKVVASGRTLQHIHIIST